VGQTGTLEGYREVNVINAMVIHQWAKERAQRQYHEDSHAYKSQTVAAKTTPEVPP
jgi:hypothetical protein